MSGFRDWGWVEAAELERIVVVSPHPDDAVLSCGQLLARHAGATVITVFCGSPARYPDPPNRWSQLSGFAPGEDSSATRREEDRRALAHLGATPVHLDLVEADLQPNQPAATVDEVAEAIEGPLRSLDPTLVLLPLGLANPEHVAVHAAVLAVRSAWPEGDGPGWIAYQDLAYHHIPGILAWRVSRLFRSGLWPTPVAMPLDPTDAAKRTALAEYESQVRALEADWGLARRLDAPTPEQYWRLAPPPPGWEGLSEL